MKFIVTFEDGSALYEAKVCVEADDRKEAYGKANDWALADPSILKWVKLERPLDTENFCAIECEKAE